MRKNLKKILWICIASYIIFLLFLINYIINERNNSYTNSSNKSFSADKINTESVTKEETDTQYIMIENNTEGIQNSETTSQEVAETFQAIKESGIVICIDPGHYKGASKIEGDNIYGYEEAVVTLKIALTLHEELKKYGIESYLTRDTDSITISGYTNENLDHGKISLRGEYAKDADLFISLHTNANQENANGYPTANQPIAINKPIILVNTCARKSPVAINVANEVGEQLTLTNYRLNLSETDIFNKVTADNIPEWDDFYNDSLNALGTVCYRMGEKGDYYGVLRGASNVGVSGLIIEHGFHTVEEVRYKAMYEDLIMQWAKADAYGIAKGLGIIE